MIQTMIISPDAGLVRSLRTGLDRFQSDLTVCRVLDHYPEAEELGQALRAHGPGAVFLGFQDPDQAADVAKILFSEARGVQVLAIEQSCTPELLLHGMRAGIREFLTPPFEDSTIIRALGSALQNLESQPVAYAASDHVFAFLPSKAGSGATSLALNISGALARDEGARVFLGEFDLNSGVLRFLLGLTNRRSVLDAVLQAKGLDEKNWPDFVTPFGNLDVMHAGPANPAVRLDPGPLGELIRFLKRNYQAVCFDLSGNLERYSIEIMNGSRHIVIVCTPEVPSLHLAREKFAYLTNLGLEKRILFALNRTMRSSTFTKSQVEDILEAPVFASFSHDPAAFQEGATRGKSLDLISRLGQECLEFVDKLPKSGAPKPRPGQSRFLEFFSLPNFG